MLIDRNCMVRILHDAAKLGVMEFKLLLVEFSKRFDRNSERTDSIPSSEEFDIDKSCLISSTKRERSHGIRVFIPGPVQLVSFEQFFIIIGLRTG